jgi:hypothetical protein
MELLDAWEEIRSGTEREEIQEIVNRLEKDNQTIPKDTARRSLEYLEELDNHWIWYDFDDVWHGTKEINGLKIAQEGLIPGSENDAFTGEYSECPNISFSNFPYALHYARNGTPTAAEIQENVNFLYESEDFGPGVEGNAPNISKIQGRERFLEELEEEHYWSHLRHAVSNFDQIRRIEESDPLVIGLPYSIIEEKTARAKSEKGYVPRIEERVQMNEIEHHQLGQGFLDLKATEEVNPWRFHFYVPHQNLEEYRRKYESENVGVLSIEAMEFKWDHQNRDTYLEDGTLDIKSVWNLETEYPMDLGKEETDYNECAWVPSISS